MSKPIDQERDPFELAYSCAVENGWESTKELARYMWDQARPAVQPVGVAVPEGLDPMSLQKAIQKVVARERMRPLSHTDSEVAESIYQAIIEQLPLYEDVYDRLTEMIEPHVDRLGRKRGFLPASVVDSVRLLLDAYLAAATLPVSGEQNAENSDIEAMAVMLENQEWAEHAGKTPLGQRLESVITNLVNKSHGAAQMAEMLETAHRFIESTEAFGIPAATGILQCKEVQWNVDESKALIAAHRAQQGGGHDRE